MPIAQINGTSLFYEETGRGEPLLLVHGSWVDHTTWDAVVPRLGSSFRVVTCAGTARAGSIRRTEATCTTTSTI